MRKRSIYEVFCQEWFLHHTHYPLWLKNFTKDCKVGPWRQRTRRQRTTRKHLLKHVIVLMNSKILLAYLRSSQSKFQWGSERASSALRRIHGEFMTAGKGRVSFPQQSNPKYGDQTPIYNSTPIPILNWIAFISLGYLKIRQKAGEQGREGCDEVDDDVS